MYEKYRHTCTDWKPVNKCSIYNEEQYILPKHISQPIMPIAGQNSTGSALNVKVCNV